MLAMRRRAAALRRAFRAPMRPAGLLAVVAMIGSASSERAATFAESFADAAALFGHWRIWPDVEDPAPDTDCLVELLPTHVSEQFELRLAPECTARFPFLNGVTGWQAGFEAIDFVDKAGTVRMPFIGRGPDWMVAGEERNGALLRYGMSRRTPDPVLAAARRYSLGGDQAASGVCTWTLGDWNAPLVDGARFFAWEVRQGEGCQAVAALNGIVAWRPEPTPDDAGAIVLYTAGTVERGRFAGPDANGGRTGTIDGAAFTLTKIE